MARDAVWHEICVVLGYLMKGIADEKYYVNDRNIFAELILLVGILAVFLQVIIWHLLTEQSVLPFVYKFIKYFP